MSDKSEHGSRADELLSRGLADVRNIFRGAGGLHGEPFSGLGLGDDFAVIGEQLAGGVPHFQRHLIGGIHGGEPLGSIRVPETVPYHFNFCRFAGIGDGTG